MPPRGESTVDRLKRELASTTAALEHTKKLLWVEQEASRKMLERYRGDIEKGKTEREALVERNRELAAVNNQLRRKMSRISTLAGKLAAETHTEE